MQDLRVARRYAKALFSLATKYNLVSSVEEDLSGVCALTSSDDAFREFWLSPSTAREEKLAIAEKLFSDRITALSMQCVRLLLEKRRETELESIKDQFVRLRRQSEGVLFVDVSSAEEMTKKQMDSLEGRLALMTGKKIEATFGVDPELIAGVRVTYENKVLDGSVRGSLRRLRDRLTHDVLRNA